MQVTTSSPVDIQSLEVLNPAGGGVSFVFSMSTPGSAKMRVPSAHAKND